MSDPVTPTQAQDFRNAVSSLSQSTDLASYVMLHLPQTGNYAGNGSNDYWVKAEAYREVFDPTSSPITKTVDGLQRAEAYFQDYSDRQGLGFYYGGWADPSVLGDADPLGVIPSSKGDYNSQTHDINLALANGLQQQLDANIDYMHSQALTGWQTHDVVPLIQGLFINVVGNSYAVVLDTSYEHLGRELFNVLQTSFNADNPNSFSNLIPSELSGYDSSYDDSYFTDSDYYFSTYDGGSYYSSDSYSSGTNSGGGGGGLKPDELIFEPERAGGQPRSLTLQGTPQYDLLIGGKGDDSISGGGGADILKGGAGADVFEYTSQSDSKPDARDIIVDFERGVDKLDIHALRTSASSTFSIEQETSRTLVSVDVEGDGSIDFQVILAGSSVVSAADIIWN